MNDGCEFRTSFDICFEVVVCECDGRRWVVNEGEKAREVKWEVYRVQRMLKIVNAIALRYDKMANAKEHPT